MRRNSEICLPEPFRLSILEDDFLTTNPNMSTRRSKRTAPGEPIQDVAEQLDEKN